MNGKQVTFYVKKRRYRCHGCRRTFYERLSFVEKYQRHTVMVAQEALTLSSEMSFTQASRLSGITTNRLLRMFDKREVPVKNVLPRVIAIDEFKGDAERKILYSHWPFTFLIPNNLPKVLSGMDHLNATNIKLVLNSFRDIRFISILE